MSNLLKDFFSAGVNDQLALMGQQCVILDYLKKENSPEFRAIITSTNSNTEVELGGITHNISGHALIPDNQAIVPKVGQRIACNNEEWLIVSVVKSAIDAAYSCDLVRVK